MASEKENRAGFIFNWGKHFSECGNVVNVGNVEMRR